MLELTLSLKCMWMVADSSMAFQQRNSNFLVEQGIHRDCRPGRAPLQTGKSLSKLRGSPGPRSITDGDAEVTNILGVDGQWVSSRVEKVVVSLVVRSVACVLRFVTARDNVDWMSLDRDAV